MGLLDKIKKWLTGGGKKKNATVEKIKKANRVTNYGGGYTSKNVGERTATEISSGIRRAKREQEKKQKQRQSQQQAYSSAFKTTPPSVKKAEAKDKQTSKKPKQSNPFKASAPPKFTYQSTALGTMSKRDIDTRTAKMNAYNENRKYQSRAADKLKPLIDAKYSGDTLESKQRIKSGEYWSDPNVMKYETLKHPIAMSAGRGALSGTTFGLSELGIALLPKSKEVEEAERLYQANKSKGAEFAGEMAGSLASFGLTGDLSKQALTRLAPNKVARLGEGATEFLAKNGLVRGAAEREAIRKLGTTATKEEIEHFARARAAKLVAALGEDAAINLTTGAVSDISHAIIDSDNPVEFVKNMGISALGNVALGGVTSAVPALRGGNVDDAFVRNKMDLPRMGEPTIGNTRGLVEFPNREASGIDVINPDLERPRGIVEIGKSEDGIDVINPNLEKKKSRAELKSVATKDTPKAEVEPKVETKAKAEPPKRKPTKTEIERNELRKERQMLQKRYEAAKNAGEDTSDIITDMQETDLMLKELDRKVAIADKARETKVAKKAAQVKEKNVDNVQKSLGEELGEATKKVESGEQITLDDAIKAVEERKANSQVEAPKAKENAEKPKTKKQRKIEEQNERNEIDNVMRKREEKLASEMREATGGEYSYRQGEHTAAEHSSINEAKRIDAEQKKVYKQLQDDNVKEMFTDENTPFGVFKTANKAEMKKAAEEATARVRDDTYGAIRRLVDKADRLKKELTEKSALSSAEHITLDDIADITAIRNIYEEAGIPLPAEYEEAFSHVVEWQRTEAAQMLKSVDLFLKENDREYRRMFISRDVDRYLRKVLNADDKAIADIKRSLDKNHGEGYFDKMIQALSEFKGSQNEASFRKAYADFQAEIFMNTKPTVWDTVNLWRHTFMLSSPKTGANNVIGNIMQRIMYNISDAMNMAGESVARAVNKDVKRTTAILKTGDQRRLANMFTSGRLGEHNLKNGKYLKGFKDQAFADAINNAASADVGEMMESSKYMGDVIKGLKYKPETVGGKVKQGFVKGGRFGSEYVSIMLNEPDSWFVERNYRSALLKYLEANGVNSSKALAGNEKLLKEARAYAKDVALENTYKKANNVVSFLEGLRKKGHTKGSNVGYKSAAIMLDAELPYLKVPANLIVNNFKYSPLGLGKGAIDAFRGTVKGDTELLNKATRELSKGLTGTGMAVLGYMMFCQDQADDNSWGFIGNAKEELKEYGVRDNSFKIGNHNYNITNMGIGSVQFLMGASLAEDLASQGAIPSYQVAFDAINKTVDTVADMSLMENAVSLLDAFGNGGDYNATVSDRLGRAATEIAGDYAAQFVPNPMRGIAKAYTDADLDTGVKKGDTSKVHRIVERNVNNFVQGVPVLNEKMLPHKVDTHGNLVNERKTKEEKRLAAINNTLNPLSPRKVNIPEVDKEELKVKKENGDPFKPSGFDPDREYKAKVGSGKRAEEIELTGKEREQVARAAKKSGFDMMNALVKKGMFGDRLGDRALKMLKDVPDDEEKARKLIFSTKEWKNADNETKNKYLEIMYGQGKGNNSKGGVSRTRKAEAYINVAGNSEGDFRYQNDLDWHYQEKYEKNNFAEKGIGKGKWADVVQSVYDASHKWDEENKKNVDTPNSAYKVKLGILAVEGLTREQRIAIYQAYRGKRNGFGWYDWDGESLGRGYYRRGWHRWHRWGSYHRKGRNIISTSPAFNARKAKVTSSGSKPTPPRVSGGSSSSSGSRSSSAGYTGSRSSSARASGLRTSGGTSISSGATNVKSSASRMSSNPKIKVTPLNVKTVKASGGSNNRAITAALEDIKKTEKKVAPPKTRRGK